MGSVPKPRCARGQTCYHVRTFDHVDEPPRVGREGALCGQCRAEHAGWYRTTGSDRWMDIVTQAIEKVFKQRPAPKRPHKAILRDLIDLDPHNGGWKKFSDRGAALRRLDAQTLRKLRSFLEEHQNEAIAREYCAELQYQELCTTVGLLATFASLPPDTPLVAAEQDSPGPIGAVIQTSRGHVVNLAALNNALPFDASAHYKGSGRDVNLKTPVLAAMLAEALRQQYPRASEREIEDTIEEVLGASRSTQRRWRERMEEVGMTWRSFRGDQLHYVALGETRGPKRESQEFSL
jgi:hypothetical protein